MTSTHERAALRPAPVASFVVDPPAPAAGEAVRLLELSFDPGGIGIAMRAWNLGDGTTTLEREPTHAYARDGAYTVTLTVTTRDGRVAAASSSVPVSTHDVWIVSIRTPTEAREGDASEVMVTVASRHVRETCFVELLRRRRSGEPEQLAVQTGVVPAAGDGTLAVAFPVAFDRADAEAGSVVFAARVRLVGALDAAPDDNARSAGATVVR